MWRALIWLNLYSGEAVRHKLKKGRKTLKMHFLPVLELHSLTAILVEPYQCPSHQSILLIQGPIHEIFTTKFQELAILKNKLFFVGHFENFFKKCFCFILMFKGQSFLTSKVGLKFWWFPWFPAVFLPWANILHPSVRPVPSKNVGCDIYKTSTHDRR